MAIVQHNLTLGIWPIFKNWQTHVKSKIFFHVSHHKPSHCLHTLHYPETESSTLLLKWFLKVNTLLLKEILIPHGSKQRRLREECCPKQAAVLTATVDSRAFKKWHGLVQHTSPALPSPSIPVSFPSPRQNITSLGGGKGLLGLQCQVTAHHFGEVKAGTQAAHHTHDQAQRGHRHTLAGLSQLSSL